MTNLNTLIDQYAILKTQLGKLEAEKKALEAALADLPRAPTRATTTASPSSVIERTSATTPSSGSSRCKVGS